MSPFCIMKDIVIDIVNDKKGHCTVNDKQLINKTDNRLVEEGMVTAHPCL